MKIRRIKLKEKIPVYDITVEDNHNFFVEDVILAHNCVYLSGEVSAQGVLITIAKNFKGTNNIPLFIPDGHFGDRFNPGSAASPRYIYVQGNDIIRKIFKSEDEPVLIIQDFEGSRIEYAFYMPILPMILINGSEGIGNGFAQKILPRDPVEIKNKIIEYLEGKTNNFEIKPYFKNFKGIIEKDGNSVEIKSKIELKETKRGFNYFVITDLSFNYTLNKFLKKLEEALEAGIINDYIDKSDNDEFYFEIKTKLNLDELVKKLNLNQKITENFTSINEINEVKEFKNEDELLKKFIDIRLHFYKRRINYQLDKLAKEIEFYADRVLFVKSVINDKLIINKRKKQDIIEDSKKLGIKFAEDHLRMNLLSMTQEKLDELEKTYQNLLKEEEYYKNITPKDLYLNELKDLNDNELKK